MSAIAMPMAINRDPARALQRQRLLALRHKENTENRGALLAGLMIFVGLPLLWILIYAGVTPRHEMLVGAAGGLLVLAGWLFGAVVGAQTIGRDFGRHSGHFLMAQPVDTRSIARTKVRSVLRTVIPVAVLAAGLEYVANWFSRPIIGDFDPRGATFVAALATILASMMAMAAAALTRRTLAATILTGVVICIVAVAPLTSQRLAVLVGSGDEVASLLPLRLVEAWNGLQARRDLAVLVNWIRAGLLGLATLLAMATCAWVVRRALAFERVPQLNGKWVTIGAAALLLGVFTASLNEVGASRRIADIAWINPEESLFAVAVGQRRVAAVSYSGGKSSGKLRLRSYSLDASGRLTVEHNGIVPAYPDGTPILAHPWPIFDDVDELIVVLQPLGAQSSETESVSEDGDDFRMLSSPRGHGRTLDDLPTSAPSSSRTSPVYVWRPDRPSDSPRAWEQLDLRVPGDEDSLLECEDARTEGNRLDLLVVRKQRYPQRPDYFACEPRIQSWWLGPDQEPQRFPMRCLLPYVSLGWASPHFDRSPDGDEFIRNWTEILWLRSDFGANQEIDSRSLPDIWALPVRRDLVMQSARRYIAVSWAPGKQDHFDWRDPAMRARIEPTITSTSPLSWLFRSHQTRLISGGFNRVWEIDRTHAIEYDVSTPRSPRRIAQVNTWPIEKAVANSDWLVLMHKTGFSVVKPR